MKGPPTLRAVIRELRRIKETPLDAATKSRPRILRKILLADSKHNPDFYIAGLVTEFLGLQFLCRWYPGVNKKEGAAAFRLGIEDAEAGRFRISDLVGDLWRVRRTDPLVFDAAVYLKYGVIEYVKILAEISTTGEEEYVRLEREKENELDYYAKLDPQLLGSWRVVDPKPEAARDSDVEKEQENTMEGIENAQL